MSGGKGGSETVESKTELPGWVNDAAKSNLQRADEISRIGYVPNMLPQVAAFSPMQEAAFGNTASAAGAFGMGGGNTTGQNYLPEPQRYAGGVKGYNTWDLANQGINKLKKERPGQYDAITGMFIDPKTGTGGKFSDNPLVAPMGGVNSLDPYGDPLPDPNSPVEQALYMMTHGGMTNSEGLPVIRIGNKKAADDFGRNDRMQAWGLK